MKKKQLGQFYTNKNIFKNRAFIKWFKSIPIEKRNTILEPFAGKNGIIKMLQDLNLVKNFISYDILPQDPDVILRDTLENFPKGFSVVITNPPFLAKNSMTRRNLDIDIGSFKDSYEFCLSICLDNCDYMAAIVPESFIVSPLFKDRLETVISLAERHIFKDTEHPVCLALFGPYKKQDYNVYINNKFIGSKNNFSIKINQLFTNTTHNYQIQYQCPTGNIGLIAIDATDCTKKIRFDYGLIVEESDVNSASRLRTRFNVQTKNGKPLSENKLERLIYLLNRNFKKYRAISCDIELTAFKGMRDDGFYRRRLDFTCARKIIDLSLSQL